MSVAIGPGLIRSTRPGLPDPAAQRASSRVRELRTWLFEARGHGVWIVLWAVVGVVGTLVAPILMDHPFVVMLLAPRALFVALAADSVDITTFVLLGTLRLGATDASYFILGRRYPTRQGLRRERRFPLAARLRQVLTRYADTVCRWLCSHGLKAGTILFLRPNGKYLAVAGAYGVQAWVAGCASVAGTALYLAGFHIGFGVLL